jgi:N-methylhydantoinase B
MEVTTKTSVDAITGEVIDAGLRYTVREMRATLIRLSYSPILYETHDFSCALLDSDGEVVAMHVDVPMHIFPVVFSVRDIVQRYGDTIREGDMFLVNDPASGGTHLNDVLMVRPIFLEGKPAFYAAVRAHYGDVGGTYPGSSVSGESTEIFHEGVRIPVVRAFVEDELQGDLLSIFLANLRTPFEAEGVFHAQAAVNRLAEQRVLAIAERYGAAALKQTTQDRLESARSRMAEAISKLPDGEYFYEDYLENSGTTEENRKPIFVRTRMTIDGETAQFDFEEVSPERSGVGNADFSQTWCGTYTVLETVLVDEEGSTSGGAKQMRVRAPEHTVLNVAHPKPLGGYADLLFGPVQGSCMALLAQLLPDDVCALGGSSPNQTVFSGGSNPRGNGGPWAIFEFPFGGWPAVRDLDGNMCIVHWCNGDIPMLWPVERAELDIPVNAVFDGIRRDSGGPGFRRGGVGIVRAFEMQTDCQFSFLGSEGILPRPGMAGGCAAALNEIRVIRDGESILDTEVPLKVGYFALKKGDIFVTLVAGGAGYGDPLEREPERVLEDIADGYVSPEGALEDYGVVLDGNEVDISATEERRAAMRDRRSLLEVSAGAEDDFDEDGRRLARISPAVAERLGVADGEIVEYVPQERAALRAWALVDDEVNDERTPLGPRGREICGVAAGERIWIRSPWGRASRDKSLPEELLRSAEMIHSVSGG